MGQSELPLAAAKAHARTFELLGWAQRRTGGTYIVMAKPGCSTLSIPTSHREVRRGTLRTLVKRAGLTDAEYGEWFKRANR